MRVLTVPNWSFGRDSDLLRRFGDVLGYHELTVHYLQSDIDLNRTVSAFSGEEESVFLAVEEMCGLAFDRIDLNHHTGEHPRIGALDVCPFVPMPDIRLQSAAGPASEASSTESGLQPAHAPEVRREDMDRLLANVEIFAARIASRFELPVFLYEKSERGRHEADLPSLRKGGFGGLMDRELNPDFGPSRSHPRLGISIVGVRDFLIAVNVNLAAGDPETAKSLAAEIRTLRAAGDHRFLGVRALGFVLASRGQSQVHLSFTLPDITTIDPAIEWIASEAVARGTTVVGAEIVGVIRSSDLTGATRAKVTERQVV